jgi:hypothetical protein
MYLKKEAGPRIVTLPDGRQMTRADLPPAGTTRWVARRKEAVVRGVLSGLIGLEEALERWDLSQEEFEGWARSMSRHGTDGLKTTLTQRFRQ